MKILLLLLLPSFLSAQWGIVNAGHLPAEIMVIHNVEPYVILKECTDERFTNNLPSEIGDYNYNYAIELQLEEEPIYFIIFNTKIGDDLESYKTVGHEVIHILQFLCEYYNIDMMREHESVAYLFEHLVNKVYELR